MIFETTNEQNELLQLSRVLRVLCSIGDLAEHPLRAADHIRVSSGYRFALSARLVHFEAGHAYAENRNKSQACLEVVLQVLT
jgi:hypothetical protein